VGKLPLREIIVHAGAAEFPAQMLSLSYLNGDLDVIGEVGQLANGLNGLIFDHDF